MTLLWKKMPKKGHRNNIDSFGFGATKLVHGTAKYIHGKCWRQCFGVLKKSHK